MELKKCPFCGSEAGIDEDDNTLLRYRVSCFKGCGDGDLWFKTKEEAVDHWNHRPIENALQADNERLKDERDSAIKEIGVWATKYGKLMGERR
jgi:hypothetical protein